MNFCQIVQLTETGLVVGVNDVAQDNLASTYTAVVRTLTIEKVSSNSNASCFQDLCVLRREMTYGAG